MTLRAVIALAALSLTPLARAGDLPPRAEALLTLRLLAYDRALDRRDYVDVVVAVLHEEGESLDRDPMARAVSDAARDFRVAGRSVRVTGCPWRGSDVLAGCLSSTRAAALLVPERFGSAVADIRRATRAAGVLSVTEDRDMVEAGLAVGLVLRASRAEVIVNVAAAREEGADLDASLFAVAEVVGR